MKKSAENQSALIAPPKGELSDFLKNEVAFQRRRKQEIFAWATSLLVAIIGGVIALCASCRSQPTGSLCLGFTRLKAAYFAGVQKLMSVNAAKNFD